ncbi:MAG: hypothetical protein QXV17_02575 [Candidatus Micrarchaeaceae archaeon]
MKQLGKRSVLRYGNAESLFLLKPKALASADEIAKSLAMCKGVDKVLLTSGEYGFVVATNSDESELAKLKNSLARIADAEIYIAKGHVTYKMQR